MLYACYTIVSVSDIAPLFFNPLDSGYFHYKFVYDSHSTISYISSRLSSNSEAFASELLENLEEMFPLHYMHNDMFCMFKSNDTQVIPESLTTTSTLKTCFQTFYYILENMFLQ